MSSSMKPPFFTLLLLISFASVNAVLFTPALPQIAHYFSVSEALAQQTITWFLIAYAFGQLLYGPIANRFGRKNALYLGISVQILSSLLCVLSGVIHEYGLLILGRFLLALGSGVGLKMTFTLVNECYEPKIASQKISYLMLAFAITPGLGVALGGVLTTHYGWMSCFYAGASYGLILLILVSYLPETLKTRDLNAFQFKHLLHGYTSQFKNPSLVMGGVLMGSATCFVYVFAALAPFIAMNFAGMSSENYGLANMIPPIGLVLGSLVGAHLSKQYSLQFILVLGVRIASVGVILILVLMLLHLPILFSLFIPMVLIYFGLCFIMANASTLAMSSVEDKAHGSAVMNFLNMGFSTLVVLMLGLFPTYAVLLPLVYGVLCVGMRLILSRMEKIKFF